MLSEELQFYLDRVYPGSKIEDENSIRRKIHIRFALGAELSNGSIERVNQAADRAFTLFKDTFENEDSELYILIYEYLEEGHEFNAGNEYLHLQFPPQTFTQFYNKQVKLATGDLEDNAITDEEKDEVRIIVRKVILREVNIKNILKGIANLEMGFDPFIGQTIFFFEPKTDRAFQMYDDRGCFVFSDQADKIRDIYLKRNKWIVDNHRDEIEVFFK